MKIKLETVKRQKMNKEKIKEDIECHKYRIEQLEKELEKENYCVDIFEQIEYDYSSLNLFFNDGCRVQSRYEGDGVIIEEMFVDAIVYDRNKLIILLKGHTNNLDDYEKVILRNKEVE